MTNGSGSGRVVPSIETCRSCIASLRARGRPVDLVDEEDVREDRPGREPERAALVDARARHVDRQEVGGPLDPVRVEGERAGDSAREERLAGARHVLDEDVSLREQGDQDQPERRFDADRGAADRSLQVLQQAAGRADRSAWRLDHVVRQVRPGVANELGVRGAPSATIRRPEA
jgi:hypothetical protein